MAVVDSGGYSGVQLSSQLNVVVVLMQSER